MSGGEAFRQLRKRRQGRISEEARNAQAAKSVAQGVARRPTAHEGGQEDGTRKTAQEKRRNRCGAANSLRAENGQAEGRHRESRPVRGCAP